MQVRRRRDDDEVHVLAADGGFPPHRPFGEAEPGGRLAGQVLRRVAEEKPLDPRKLRVIRREGVKRGRVGLGDESPADDGDPHVLAAAA